MAGPERDTVRARDTALASQLSDVASGFGRLVKGEIMLARIEATEGLKAAGGGIAKLAVAGMVGLVGLNILAGAAVAALAATGMDPVWAALVVGICLCLLAIVLATAGRAALRLQRFWPGRTVRGVRRDAEAVRAGLSETGATHV